MTDSRNHPDPTEPDEPDAMSRSTAVNSHNRRIWMAERSYLVAVRGRESGTRTAGEWQYADKLATTGAAVVPTPDVPKNAPEPGHSYSQCAGASDVNRRHVLVEWMSVTGATGYEVEWRTQGQRSGTASESVELTGTATTYAILNPDYATDYHVRVRAMNAAGEGPWSNEADVRVDERIEEKPRGYGHSGQRQVHGVVDGGRVRH